MADNAFSASELASEEWRDIPGWEGFYQASSLGRIKSLSREVDAEISGRRFLKTISERILKTFDANGYEYVAFSKEGRVTKSSVHRLVAMAFHGLPDSDSLQVAHNDGDPSNNREANLRWATCADNLADRHAHGTFVVNRPSPEAVRAKVMRASKFTEAEIRQIRALNDPSKDREIASSFGVFWKVVQLIRLRKTYKWVRD